jgi:L-ascorbate metabolism protein UlaG (beta-lactamase superfamily)
MLQHDGLQIRTFGSTDAGVSFWVEMADLQVFHAGDLNWWYWHDESTPQELAAYERDFKAAVAAMEGLRADIAFFPVDPRLGEYSHHGALHLIEKVRPRVFFPMHFGYDYAAAARFRDAAALSHPAVRVIAPEHERQSFQLD